MENLRITLIVVGYGLALWLLLGALVAALWFALFKWSEHRRRIRFVRAWNEWMGFR